MVFLFNGLMDMVLQFILLIKWKNYLKNLSKSFAIPNKFTLPIDLSLSKSDELPVVISHPESPVADIFTNLAESVLILLSYYSLVSW